VAAFERSPDGTAPLLIARGASADPASRPAMCLNQPGDAAEDGNHVIQHLIERARGALIAVGAKFAVGGFACESQVAPQLLRGDFLQLACLPGGHDVPPCREFQKNGERLIVAGLLPHFSD